MENVKKLLVLVAVVAAFVGGIFLTQRKNETFGLSTSRLNPVERIVMSAVTATTTATPMNVADYRLIGYTVATNNASATLKVFCSTADTAPTVSSTASQSNRYAAVSFVDLATNGNIDGATGLVFTNSTTVRHIQIQNSNFRWCSPVLSPWTAGSTTITSLPATNQ